MMLLFPRRLHVRSSISNSISRSIVTTLLLFLSTMMLSCLNCITTCECRLGGNRQQMNNMIGKLSPNNENVITIYNAAEWVAKLQAEKKEEEQTMKAEEVEEEEEEKEEENLKHKALQQAKIEKEHYHLEMEAESNIIEKGAVEMEETKAQTQRENEKESDIESEMATIEEQNELEAKL
jgi:hypothetical protein